MHIGLLCLICFPISFQVLIYILKGICLFLSDGKSSHIWILWTRCCMLQESSPQIISFSCNFAYVYVFMFMLIFSFLAFFYFWMHRSLINLWQHMCWSSSFGVMLHKLFKLVVLKLWFQHLFVLLNAIEDPEELLLMWVTPVDICHIRNLKNWAFYKIITY